MPLYSKLSLIIALFFTNLGQIDCVQMSRPMVRNRSLVEFSEGRRRARATLDSSCLNECVCVSREAGPKRMMILLFGRVG